MYAQLGDKLRESYVGWQAAVLTGNPPLGLELGLKAKRTHTMFNGPIECRLLRFDVEPKYFEQKRVPGALPAFDTAAARERPGATMFANRLRKNLESLGAWARKADIACYRVYDADMPEYAFSIDIYAASTSPDALRFAYVQEYAPPATIEPEKARSRRAEAFSVIPEVLDVPRERAYLRTRRKQKGGAQYTKLAERGEFTVVGEGGLELLVNFTDYLDTGLFLDHRPTRARIRELAAGKSFLNLFAYTGTASVFAAAGGARMTTTVDLSNTYLDWARRNLDRNGFDDASRHRLLQEDVLAWLEQPPRERFDLIFLDPPTVSRSKRMAKELDLQRDHVELIRSTLLRLESRRTARVLQQLPQVPARRAGARGSRGRGRHASHDSERLRAQSAHPSVLRDSRAARRRANATARALAEVSSLRRSDGGGSRRLSRRYSRSAGSGRKSTKRSRRARTSAARAASARTRRAASAACRARTRRGTRTAELLSAT